MIKAKSSVKKNKSIRVSSTHSAVYFILITIVLVTSGALVSSCTSGYGLSLNRARYGLESGFNTAVSLSLPSADGLVTYASSDTVLDVSHTEDGYIMANYQGRSDRQLLKIVYPDQKTYLYRLQGGYESFPLTGGSGSYTISVLSPSDFGRGDTYDTVLTAGIDVLIEDQLLPFLLPSQYVNYSPGSPSALEASRLTVSAGSRLETIAILYDYITENVRYDSEKAAEVDSGYVPDPDRVLEKKQGICFDYASLLCAMLRSRQIPAMLVTGYSGSSYHAWVRVYSEKGGLLDGTIPIEKGWNLLDPSYAASHTPEETRDRLRSSVYTPEYYY